MFTILPAKYGTIISITDSERGDPVFKQTARLLACLGCLLLALAGCGGEPGGGIFRYDMQSIPASLDPQLASSESETLILANVFEGLTALDAGGEAVPACAERIEVSADGLVYTFPLREGLVWSDGSPLTAADFVFGLRRLFDEGFPSPHAEEYASIQNAPEILAGTRPAADLGVSAPDERTVRIVLSAPDADFPALLAQSPAMPCQEAFFREQKGRYGRDSQNLLYNGPFYVRSWTAESVSLRRNERYRAPVAADGVNLYAGRGDAVDRFLAGESDACLVPYHRLSDSGAGGEDYLYHQSWALLFRFDRSALSSEEVRAALIGVFPEDRFSSLLPGSVRAAASLVPSGARLSGTPWSELSSGASAAARPADPKQTFYAALSAMGLEKLPRTTLLVPDVEPGTEIGSAMQHAWQTELSAYINMEPLAYDELIRRVAAGDFDLAIAPIPATGNSPADVLRYFLGGTGEEDDGSLAALLAPAGRREEQAETVRRYQQAEQLLIDRYAVYPLFEAPSLFLTREGAAGIAYSPATGAVLFSAAHLTEDG